MSNLTYIGVLKPVVAADRFVSSIFKNEIDEYFVQVEKEGKIAGFNPIIITRAIIACEHPIPTKESDQVIYSFITNNGNLLFGVRETIEFQLISILDSGSLNVHSRLLVSSFLKLFSKTLELIEASNEDLKAKGVTEMISSELPFTKSKKSAKEPSELTAAIVARFQKFHQINNAIRIEDIAFINNNKAYFIQYELNITAIINRQNLTDPYNEMLSNLVMACIEKKTINIKTMIYENAESYEFLLFSEFVILDQYHIESIVSDKAQKDKTDEEQSILEIGILVDQEIHSQDHPSPDISVPTPYGNEVLTKSFLSIIAKA